MKTNLKEELPFCECGCGERVKKQGNRFINGHNAKGKNNPFYKKTHSEEAKIKMLGKNAGENHYLYGKNQPEKVKEKISEALTGENNPMYGKKHTKRTTQKISKALTNKKRDPFSEETLQKMSKANSGENNPNWKGGTSYESYCPAWLDKEYKQWIRDRDRNIVWDIGYWYKGGLSIHHIDYNKKDCHPKNLITVSVGMNAAVNFHKEFYIEWFQTAMNHRLGYEYGT